MVAAAAQPLRSTIAIDDQFHRTYTSYYQVITDDVNDGPITAVEASGIPAYRSSYSFGNDADVWAFCNGATADLENVRDTAKKWLVTVTHTTRPSFRCGDTRIENPLDEPLRIYGSFMQFTRPADTDRNGDAIVNTVDEPFVPAVERDDSRDSLIIERNSTSISLSTRTSFRDAVNSNVQWGLPVRTIKLQQWTWAIQYWGTCNAYIAERFEFHINEDTWDFSIYNQGTRHLSVAGPPRQFAQNKDNRDQPDTLPRPLDANGNLLDLTTDAPYYAEFRVYNEMDFSTLGFPDPLPGPFV